MLRVPAYCVQIVVVVLALYGCSSPHGRDAVRQRISTSTLSTLDNDYDVTPNADGTLVLCVQKQKPLPGVQPLSFFVYATRDTTLVYERQMENGTVRWLGTTTLSVTRIPGNINGEEDDSLLTERVELNPAW